MRTALFFVACFCWMSAVAQVTLPFSFKHYSSRDGLSSNEIFSSVQDADGYLWIATNRGLQRFDGFQFKTFRHQQDNPGTIPENVITHITTDKKNNLWIVTAEGYIGTFDRSRFVFRPAIVKPIPTLRYYEKRLFIDDQNNIFLLLRGGPLYFYNKEKNEFSAAHNFIPLKPGWGIVSIALQPKTKKYWLGIQNGGIAIYNHQTKNLSYYGNNIEHEPAIDLFKDSISTSHAMFDKQGRYWFDHWGDGQPYSMMYNAANKKKPLQQFEFSTELKMYNELHGYLQQKNGSIWIRGLHVLGYFNEAKNKFELITKSESSQGIQFHIINSLYEDREQNIWVGTNNSGLYRFNPSQQYFTNVEHKHPVTKDKGEGSVMSFLETRNGNILVSAWGDGMMRYDKNFNILPLGINGLKEHSISSVWDMCQSVDENIIWMACQPGIIKFNQSTGKSAYYNPAKLQHKTVRQIVEDVNGNLWLGMQNLGLFWWQAKKGVKGFDKGLVEIEFLKGELINKLETDHHGLLWVSTGNKGLIVIDINTGKLKFHFGEDKSGPFKINSNGVTSTTILNDSLIAISSTSGLFLYNRYTNTLRTLVKSESLAGNIISLEKDNSNYIWAGTTNALYRISPKTAATVAFDRNDGINNDRFTLSASYRLSDGRLLFGNSNEFIAYDPSVIKINHHTPKVSITEFKIGGNNLDADSIIKLKKLILQHKENAIQVSFSPLSFANVYPVRYKLENFDKEWQMADREMKASYSYLPPGNYTLLLQALDAEGNMNGDILRIDIMSKAPFWQTWWFYALVTLAVVSVLFWLDRQRMKRKETMQQVRINIANGLQDDVNTSLNNINILSEIARIKSDKDPVKTKDYLEQIHVQSHNMITALDDMLWSLNPNNDAMDKTINRIREYIDSLMQRYNVHIELMIDKEVEKLELDMRLRHEAFLLFKEGIRSLVDAGTSHCIVQLDCEKNKLHFNIEFDNKDCDMQQLNNLLHRHDMETRLQNLGAKLDVHVYKSRSIIQIHLPLS